MSTNNISVFGGSKPHIVLFPFMAKGHMIPLLQLARLLVNRGVSVTIFTTPANHPFVADSLTGVEHVSIIDLPFPQNMPEIPQGVESTEKLPSMSLFVPFVNGIKQMQPHFEEALESIHSKVSCIISDGFLHWTLQSASRFGIPRVSFLGMNNYATTIMHALRNGLIGLHESPDEPFTVPDFPWIRLTRNHFDEPFDKRDPRGPYLDFMMESVTATMNSHGKLVNSFYELEKTFADYYNRECKPKAWCVGPLCLAQPKVSLVDGKKPKWIDWLDGKLAENRRVMYVAFGSQAKISSEQFCEIAMGLEESKVCFLWVVGKNAREIELVDGFEERVKERGIVLKEWVDQKEILEHEAVHGFLSHCGWSSVLEGICAEVPILAWPMLAEQWLNATMVAEEIRVGMRVNTVDGSAKGFVNRESLKDSVIELMEGEKARGLKERLKEVAEAARNAMSEGGSSRNSLDQMIEEVHELKKKNSSDLLSNNGIGE